MRYFGYKNETINTKKKQKKNDRGHTLSKLESLTLKLNRFSGSLGYNLFRTPNLKHLDVSSNINLTLNFDALNYTHYNRNNLFNLVNVSNISLKLTTSNNDYTNFYKFFHYYNFYTLEMNDIVNEFKVEWDESKVKANNYYFCAKSFDYSNNFMFNKDFICNLDTSDSHCNDNVFENGYEDGSFDLSYNLINGSNITCYQNLKLFRL